MGHNYRSEDVGLNLIGDFDHPKHMEEVEKTSFLTAIHLAEPTADSLDEPASMIQ